MKIDKKLQVIKSFQLKYQGAHVGGSFGLLLHGIDLKRDLINSDIDMTVNNPLPENIGLENYEPSSDPEDFDYAFRCYPDGLNSDYAKVDVRISKDEKFTIISKDGIDYNVSFLDKIISWKRKYADKGVKKHIDDLIVISGGERPVTKDVELFDLPF